MTDTDKAEPTDAFDYLNEYFYFNERGSFDGAIDSIFMMHEKDWELLEAAWKDGSQEWRENCVSVLGHGPIEECVPLLRQALFDDNIDVAKIAAGSFAGLLIDRDDEYDPPVYLDDEMVARMRYLVGLQDKYIEYETEVLENLHRTSDGKWEFIPRES
ncbi:HEAT repeat domain-containing protein [Chamaesiphon minutus]|uniref:HEAT repeat domain-containing protein n=1 Tax=Chamaesiphon minutus (strain ATCC 27169 / PCC 6605) TaxID=1173020 RepID=K9UPN4_CHAP6|nr:HEAT repeat domain-containing protein [Chamaesiphon minutus]AFY96653.1 hypothetical protein Cha6605_5798 [Chamaesiphon minutus PCC 6605]